MRLEDFGSNLDKLINDLPNKIDDLILTFGVNLRTVVTDRITMEGKDKNGSKFPALTSVYAKKKGNRDVGFRNLVFSGNMINNFNIYKTSSINTRQLEYNFGFSSDTELNKAEGNSFGNNKWSGIGTNIIEPSKTEISEQEKQFNDELLIFIKSYLP